MFGDGRVEVVLGLLLGLVGAGRRCGSVYRLLSVVSESETGTRRIRAGWHFTTRGRGTHSLHGAGTVSSVCRPSLHGEKDSQTAVDSARHSVHPAPNAPGSPRALLRFTIARSARCRCVAPTCHTRGAPVCRRECGLLSPFRRRTSSRPGTHTACAACEQSAATETRLLS